MCCGRVLSAPSTTAAAEPPTGRLLVAPYKFVYPNRLFERCVTGWARASTYAYHTRSIIVPAGLPLRVCTAVFERCVTGRVRASTYAYHTRSVIVRRHCRPGRVLRFLSGALPGGLGHQRMHTMSVALLSGGTAAKKGSGECLTPLLCLFRTFRCCRNDCRRNNCGNRCQSWRILFPWVCG